MGKHSLGVYDFGGWIVASVDLAVPHVGLPIIRAAGVRSPLDEPFDTRHQQCYSVLNAPSNDQRDLAELHGSSLVRASPFTCRDSSLGLGSQGCPLRFFLDYGAIQLCDLHQTRWS